MELLILYLVIQEVSNFASSLWMDSILWCNILEINICLLFGSLKVYASINETKINAHCTYFWRWKSQSSVLNHCMLFFIRLFKRKSFFFKRKRHIFNKEEKKSTFFDIEDIALVSHATKDSLALNCSWIILIYYC